MANRKHERGNLERRVRDSKLAAALAMNGFNEAAREVDGIAECRFRCSCGWAGEWTNTVRKAAYIIHTHRRDN